MDDAQALLEELRVSDGILRQLGEEVELQQGTLSEKVRRREEDGGKVYEREAHEGVRTEEGEGVYREGENGGGYRGGDGLPGVLPSPRPFPPATQVPAGGYGVSPEEVLLALRESEVRFGNPISSLTHLTPALFEALQIPLDEIWRRQMRTAFDFYYMTVPAILTMRYGTQLRTLRCHLDFEPGLPDGIIIQRLFPASSWKEILNVGGSVQVALDGQLDWQLGVSSTTLQALLQVPLPGEIQAHVKNSNALKAHIAIPDYSWRVGRVDINAAGESGATCDWDLRHADMRLSQTINFAIVFKVPKGVRQIQLKGVVAARPARNWLIEGLRAIFDLLSPALQEQLRQDEDSTRAHFVLGDHQIWSLALPQ